MFEMDGLKYLSLKELPNVTIGNDVKCKSFIDVYICTSQGNEQEKRKGRLSPPLVRMGSIFRGTYLPYMKNRELVSKNFALFQIQKIVVFKYYL